MLFVEVSINLRTWALGIANNVSITARQKYSSNMTNQGCTYPYCRPLSTVQQVELDAGFINDPPGQAIEGINLSNDCSLANASEARVARTCAEIVELWCNQSRPRTGPRCSSACLGTGMATPYDDNIEGSIIYGLAAYSG